VQNWQVIYFLSPSKNYGKYKIGKLFIFYSSLSNELCIKKIRYFGHEQRTLAHIEIYNLIANNDIFIFYLKTKKWLGTEI
jgi:hypothetical protein